MPLAPRQYRPTKAISGVHLTTWQEEILTKHRGGIVLNKACHINKLKVRHDFQQVLQQYGINATPPGWMPVCGQQPGETIAY